MSHRLTQPEEIDHILKTMAGHEMDFVTPIPDRAQSSRNIRDIQRDAFSVATNIPSGIAHKKSVPGLPYP